MSTVKLHPQAPNVPPHHRTQEYYELNKELTQEEIVNLFKSRLQKQPHAENYITYFTPDNILTILTSLYFGADIQTALNVAGVPYQIYLQWKREAIDHEGLARNFFVLEQVAKAEFELNCLKQLTLMGTVDTKATLFLLERTQDKYAPRNYINIDGLAAGYMEELTNLIGTGSMTVEAITQEIGGLTEEQITFLTGVEARYKRDTYIKERRKQQLLVKGNSDVRTNT